jgi:hypothetical protein
MREVAGGRMIEKSLPLKIPPGVIKNGTLFDRAGRWADGNLVRFPNGVAQACTGSTTLTTAGAAVPGGEPHSARILPGDAGDPLAVVGTETELYTLQYLSGGNAEVADLTPAGFTSSTEDFMWQFDILGDVLLASAGSDIYSYDLSVGGASFAAVAGAPAVVTGHVVTPERFLVVFDESGDTNVLRWASQGTTTTWTPASTNSAGSLPVPILGRFFAGRRANQETLIWTTTGELWALSYVGAPLYYGARKIADNCRPISRNAIAQIGNETYWMGERGFFVYDGYVRSVACELADDIFPNLATTKRWLSYASVHGPWEEVWFHYPSTSGSNGERDKVAIFNRVLKVWSPGSISRATGTDALWPGRQVNSGRRSAPLYFDTTTVYAHDTETAFAGAFLESGPIMLDPAGARRMRVQKAIPDNVQQSTNEPVIFYFGTYPKVAESSVSTQIPTAGGEINLRTSGRYIRIKQDLDVLTSRIGTWRLGVIPEGRR